MRVFKVLRVDGDRRFSAMVVMKAHGQREYPVGKVVVPQEYCGPLAAFRTRRAADMFVEFHSGRILHDMKVVPADAIESDEWDLWFMEYGVPFLMTMAKPNGTVLVDALKCLE